MKLGGREHLKQHVGVKLSPSSTECVSQLLLLREKLGGCSMPQPGAHSLSRNLSFLRWPEGGFSLSKEPTKTLWGQPLLEQHPDSVLPQGWPALTSFYC